MSPASRAVSSVRQFGDTRKGVVPKAINMLSGVKLTDVDVAKESEIALRNRMQDLLKSRTGLRVSRRSTHRTLRLLLLMTHL